MTERIIGVVTGTRADYGLYRPILRRMAAAGLNAELYVCGMHLAHEFGHSIDLIERDGFKIAERIETLLAGDTPEAVASAMGLGVIGFARRLSHRAPSLLLILGDRTEMLAAATAALPFGIPIAHIHGGELTEGAIDDAIRHALSKMSHIHFVSTEESAARLARMGEEPARIHVTGAPGLDNLAEVRPLGDNALADAIGMKLTPAPLLVTFHPETLEHEETAAHFAELLAVLDGIDRPIVFTYPNADTRGRTIAAAIERFVEPRPNCRAIRNLGTDLYFSLMAHAAAMVGNSSSGIIEAASFKLPVVNIGSRQRGRMRPRNVIDAEPAQGAIRAAIGRAVDPAFRAALNGLANPYGDGHASERIVAVLQSVPLDGALIRKRFYDGAQLVAGTFRHA